MRAYARRTLGVHPTDVRGGTEPARPGLAGTASPDPAIVASRRQERTDLRGNDATNSAVR
jgi:hypothetical protein